jgi:predicted nuclease with TOPRIM domain
MKLSAQVMLILHFTLAPILILALPLSPASAEEAAQTQPASDAAKSSLIETLNHLIDTIESINQKKQEKQAALQTEPSREQKELILEEISLLEKRLDELKENFEKIVTIIDLKGTDAKLEEKFQWKEEILDLLAPLVKQVKKATARPRQIERLRSEVDFYQTQVKSVRQELSYLETLIDDIDAAYPRLQEKLDGLKMSWIEREKQLSNLLTVTRHELSALLSQKQSILTTAQEALKLFFKSRGKNLFLAFAAFISAFVLLRLLHRFIYRFSPIHKGRKRSFAVRLMDVVYHTFTVLIATIALLIVLYIFGDWLLLSLALIFCFGLAWSARTGLLMFWKQVQFMLNLGTVREDERVIYNGIPWRVASLNVFAILENPLLSHKRMRLPLNDLIGLSSRPYKKEEPWFPCHVEDWVVLADGRRGKVISQSPEMVQLVLPGGSLKTFLTPEFLAQSPINISTGFRLKAIFGLDYKHQENITKEILDQFSEALSQGLVASGYGDVLNDTRVEVENPAASSLDLMLIADFDGKADNKYNYLRRTMMRIGIDACNQYGWSIPFTQVTVHQG